MPTPLRGDHNQGDSASIAEVIHELRAPLGGVEAMTKLLRETPLTPSQLRIVDGLCAAAEHLRHVANDLLDGGALSAASLRLDEKAVLLHDLLAHVAISADARAAASGLRFILSVDDKLNRTMMADGRRIRQMLENLIDNAFKVTVAGEVRLVVKHTDRRGRFAGVRFEVIDTGPGFTASEGSRLFQKYGVLENGVPGTGLGLAMVSKFAKAMGGEAGCHGLPGSGATFWFTLRLKVKDHEHALSSTTSDDDASEGLCDSTARRILVVDDNQANRLIMAAVLEHFGMSMVEAASAEEALDLLPTGSFAAVMMDHTLPGMSGLDALALIRNLPEPLRSIPVIPVTGRVSQSDKSAFAAAGATGFIEKPVTARAVRAALTTALSQAALV